eukprot:scaffold294259_cov31-Tisochrysis_lutea.AAC.2
MRSALGTSGSAARSGKNIQLRPAKKDAENRERTSSRCPLASLQPRRDSTPTWYDQLERGGSTTTAVRRSDDCLNGANWAFVSWRSSVSFAAGR